MHLEDPSPSLEDVLSNSELLVACYYIIESAVSYMASDRLQQLDQRQRDQVLSLNPLFFNMLAPNGDLFVV